MDLEWSLAKGVEWTSPAFLGLEWIWSGSGVDRVKLQEWTGVTLLFLDWSGSGVE